MRKKCKYCGGITLPNGTMCSNCYRKSEKVHELWLICQEIKKLRNKK